MSIYCIDFEVKIKIMFEEHYFFNQFELVYVLTIFLKVNIRGVIKLKYVKKVQFLK